MKIIAILFLGLTMMSYGQTLKVKGKKYLDKENFTLVKYSTCDSTKTMRIVTDNELSLSASNLLTKMHTLQKADTSSINEGVVHFIRRSAIDSNLNVLLIDVKVDQSYRIANLEYISDILDNDDILHQDIDFLKPTKVYVNYFQVFMNSNKAEHVLITLVLKSGELKRYNYYNTEM